MPNSIDKGNLGELLAKEYLIKKGYEILEVNWRAKHLEIDLITLINETLVIVEVKLRVNDTFGAPEDFVTISKQKKVIKAANAYIEQHNIDLETRFDIISIIQNISETKIEHFEGAFYPTL